MQHTNNISIIISVWHGSSIIFHGSSIMVSLSINLAEDEICCSLYLAVEQKFGLQLATMIAKAMAWTIDDVPFKRLYCLAGSIPFAMHINGTSGPLVNLHLILPESPLMRNDLCVQVSLSLLRTSWEIKRVLFDLKILSIRREHFA